MYQAFKYWGKKPHNIWRSFIEAYCPPGGVILDPFAGSAVAAFEAVKAGRRAIAFDLNPITSYLIETLTASFDEKAFAAAFASIELTVKGSAVYQRQYLRDFGNEVWTVANYNWEDGRIIQIALERHDGKSKRPARKLISPEAKDQALALKSQKINIPFWYPNDAFPDSPVIKQKFINDIGGNSFANLWTRRSLYILSHIFDEIQKISDSVVQRQLLFGFIQTLHLTSKMVVPRHAEAKRDFSGSWGRADYMVRRRSMEQNPLMVFRRSCVEKQGVVTALRDAERTLPRNLKVEKVSATARRLNLKRDISFGVRDVADLTDVLPPQSVDFVLTDPPYAGLVPYLDLSLVWLVWLRRIDNQYWPELQSEITIKRGVVSREEYRRRLQNAFKQVHTVLKDDGYLVVTFHHKKVKEWNDFVSAVKLAGFRFDKVTHQYNRRSGESNVSNPYGTSGADFYIRLVKHREVDFTDDHSGLEHFIVQKAAEIIASRNEPTPYDFLVAGLLPEMIQAGFLASEEYSREILRVLDDQVGNGKIFTRTPNPESKAGDLWWFSNPRAHISYPDRPLNERVEETVQAILRRRSAVKFDDIIAELFQTYPNGLTPDPRGIVATLEKFGRRSAGKWKLAPEFLEEGTRHSEVIRQLLVIGARAGYITFVGKREQPETCEDQSTLGSKADIVSLRDLPNYNELQLSRIEMIDVLWLDSSGSHIMAVFEVENSTDFVSAINRASNLDESIPKFMILPDSRESELRRQVDPLFLESFHAQNWRFLTYSVISRFAGLNEPALTTLRQIAARLGPDDDA